MLSIRRLLPCGYSTRSRGVTWWGLAVLPYKIRGPVDIGSRGELGRITVALGACQG